MKREDWNIIKNTSKEYPKILSLCELDLLVLDRSTKIGRDSMGETENDPKNEKELLDRINNTQINDCFTKDMFLFLNKAETFDVLSAIYIDKNSVFINVIGTNSVDIMPNQYCMEFTKDELVTKTYHAAWVEKHHKVVDLDDKEIEGYLKNAVAVLNILYSFLFNLQNSDYYCIQKRNKQTKKERKISIKKDKKPWARGDLSSIVYLNKFPEQKEKVKSKGGHHASPRYHQRIGHMHTMRHEKFKNHPDYMKPIWRKPVWVGVKETIVDGVTYKVL